jgi:hypothetical protein
MVQSKVVSSTELLIASILKTTTPGSLILTVFIDHTHRTAKRFPTKLNGNIIQLHEAEALRRKQPRSHHLVAALGILGTCYLEKETGAVEHGGRANEKHFSGDHSSKGRLHSGARFE